ncbi:MAG TPA: MFS transporter [Herpetosiphonaceae bacterium]
MSAEAPSAPSSAEDGKHARLPWGQLMILGTFMFAVGAVEPTYSSFMPQFWSDFLTSSALIGVIMGIDNFLALTLLPYFGALSDRTQTRWGRRRPFVILGLAFAILGLIGIPIGRALGGIPMFLASAVLFLGISMYRGTGLALVSDSVPRRLLGNAYGVVTFIMSIAVPIGLMASQKLYALDPSYTFLFGAGASLVGMLAFALLFKEPPLPAVDAVEHTPQSIISALRFMIRLRDRSTILILLVTFTFYVSFNSFFTWLPVHTAARFQVSMDEATSPIMVMGLTTLFFILPISFLGTRFNRQKMMVLGLSGLVVVSLCLHTIPTTVSGMYPFMFLFGLSMAVAMLNAYPLIVERAAVTNVGTFTGLYFLCDGLGGTVGPFLSGAIFDLLGSRNALFLILAPCFGLALLLTLRLGSQAREQPVEIMQAQPVELNI